MRYAEQACKLMDALDLTHDDPLVARLPHSKHMKTRLDFGTFAMGHREAKLDAKMIEALWHVLIERPPHPVDRNHALSWFVRTLTSPMAAESPGVLEATSHLLHKVMCDPTRVDRPSMTINMWHTMQQLFCHVNDIQNKAIYVGLNDSIAVIHFAKIAGLDTLWDILIRARDPSVRIYRSAHKYV